MAWPLFFALCAGGYGAKKCFDAHEDQQLATTLNLEASLVVALPRQRLGQARTDAQATLERVGQLRLEIAHRQLGRFVRLAQAVRQVEVPAFSPWARPALAASAGELVQLRDVAFQANHLLQGGAQALGAGALVGIASYGLTMTLASASTGTAIAVLSGAAATNATLAWLGGGTLAAGGLGVAGGSAALGLLVAGPALAVGGSILAARARENVAMARVNLAEAHRAATEMEATISFLQGVDQVAGQYEGVLRSLEERAALAFDDLEDVLQRRGTNYQRYSQAQRQRFWMAYEFARELRQAIDLPLFASPDCAAPEGSPALMAGQMLLGPGEGR